MIKKVAVMMIVMGILLMTYEMFIPVNVSDYGTVIANHIAGLMLLIIGLVVIFARIQSTGIGGLMELPKEDMIQCFYQPGNSTNTKILYGKLMENNLIKAGDKLINYKGGGFRIAGHECVRVHGMVVSNIPEWLGETFAEYKKKYGVTNIYKLRALHENFQHLDKNSDLRTQLENIPGLENVVDDEEKMNVLVNMNVNELKQMAETLWDGTTIRLESDIDEFIQTATPSQVHQYAQKEYMMQKNRDKMLKGSGQSDWVKYAVAIGFLMFMAALGLGIFMSMAS